MNERIRQDPPDESPPLFPSWTHWYVLVLSFLGIIIICLYIFTRTFE